MISFVPGIILGIVIGLLIFMFLFEFHIMPNYIKTKRHKYRLEKLAHNMAYAITLDFNAINEEEQKEAEEALFNSHEDYLIYLEDVANRLF